MLYVSFKSAAMPLAAACLAAAVTGCGAVAPSSTTADKAPVTHPLTVTTAAPSGDAGAITWAMYRATTSLDPITAFDLPENIVIDSLCEGLLRQQPDLTVAPGLAESADYADPRTLVLKLRPGVTFWDGKPLTAADVVYSLERARGAKSGSFYPQVFDRVTSIAATGADVVTIRLSKPDYWLKGQLSTMPGFVIEKAFAERQGKKYGSTGGGVMCTGPFKLKSWRSGGDLVIERNDGYWDAARRARVRQITFRAVPDDANLTAAFLTGAVDGTYNPTLATYDELKRSGKVSVTSGPSLLTDALVVSGLDGVMGDARVRQALSLAIDRNAYINLIYHGQATLPRGSVNPGAWGYGRSAFEAAAQRLPEMRQDIPKAKALIAQAGAAGKTLVVATSPGLHSVSTATTSVTEAARAIGLRVKLKNMGPDTFYSLFVDPKLRKGVDLFPTINAPSFADPGPYLATYAVPGAPQNFSGWQDPQVSRLLDQARATADDDARAGVTAKADARVTAELPWIPMAHMDSVLTMSRRISGAPASYVFENGSWAGTIGAAGR